MRRALDIDPEFQQFAVDARCTPQRVIAAHLTNQFPGFLRNRWAARLAVANFPAPKQPKPFAMPTDHRLRLDHNEGGPPARPKLAPLCPEEAIGRRQLRSLNRALQDTELVSQSEDFEL